jgi:uncharacterized phage protein gp47/JayE
VYNEQTFEKITERTLNSVDLKVYKGEGSFLYNMLEPTNTELAQLYIELEYQFNKVMLTENYDTLLDQRASEFGYYRKQGTEATGTAEFFGTPGTAIYNGTLIKCNGLQYVTIKDFVIEENGDNTSPIHAIVEGLFDIKIDGGINKMKTNCVLYSNSVDKTIAEVFAWRKDDCVVMDVKDFKSYTAENLFVIGWRTE